MDLLLSNKVIAAINAIGVFVFLTNLVLGGEVTPFSVLILVLNIAFTLIYGMKALSDE